MLEANIDDQNPELYQDVLEALFAAGALDVLLQPVYMKKQRPGILLKAICRPAQAEALAALALEQSSSLGVRISCASRRTLERRIVQVNVCGVSVRVKLGEHQGRLKNVAPEYEDCRRIAQETGMPVKLVYQQAIAAFWQDNQSKGD